MSPSRLPDFIGKMRSFKDSIATRFSSSFSDDDRQKLLLSPPPVWSRVLIWTLSAGTLSLIAWATFNEFEETAVLPGQLVTLRSEIKIVSPETAIVDQVNVTDHQHVSKDEILFRLSREDFEPRLQTLKNKLNLLEQRYQQDLRSFKIRQVQIQSQISLNKGIVDRLSNLFEQGSVQEIQLLEKKNELFQNQQQFQNLLSERDKATSTFKIDHNDVKNQLAELEGRSRHFDIRSPMQGTMQNLGVQVKGERIQAGNLLATVIPQENLVASVKVSSRLSAPIQSGKSAAITVDAFPANDFGTLEGIVSSISPTTSDPDSAGLAPSYVARISISPAGIPEGYPADELRSGMGVSARVVLDQKPIISMIFEFVGDMFEPLSERS